MIDEDLAHQSRRHGHEMGPALERHPVPVHEAQVDLVDERGRLKGVARLLVSQVGARDLLQFGIHQRDETLQRHGVALAPFDEKGSHVVQSRDGSVIDLTTRWSHRYARSRSLRESRPILRY